MGGLTFSISFPGFRVKGLGNSSGYSGFHWQEMVEIVQAIVSLLATFKGLCFVAQLGGLRPRLWLGHIDDRAYRACGSHNVAAA